MLLRNNVNEFAHLITLEMDKLLSEAKGEVLLSADIIEYYAQNTEKLLAPKNLKQCSGTAYIKNKPLEILLGLQP
ncbi:aldehyde dehydrogenase family protein [Neisseria sp. Ec49-e6-T10]|uniref:aldehyde dehydrogenase family protein n=1 Tax=Neisseria sp. Ec49-e6-T10 TaxID=3140744 RepID=UPI003EC02EDD